jgi:hypothetical protein
MASSSELARPALDLRRPPAPAPTCGRAPSVKQWPTSLSSSLHLPASSSSLPLRPTQAAQIRRQRTRIGRARRAHGAHTGATRRAQLPSPRLRLLSQSWICGGAWCWSRAAADSEPAAASLPRPPSLSLSRRSSCLLPLPSLFSGVAARPGGAARQLGCWFRLLARPEAGTVGPRRRGVCRSSRTTPGMASGGRNWMVPSRIQSPATAILPLKATWRWLCGCGPGPSADSLRSSAHPRYSSPAGVKKRHVTWEVPVVP